MPWNGRIDPPPPPPPPPHFSLGVKKLVLGHIFDALPPPPLPTPYRRRRRKSISHVTSPHLSGRERKFSFLKIRARWRRFFFHLGAFFEVRNLIFSHKFSLLSSSFLSPHMPRGQKKALHMGVWGGVGVQTTYYFPDRSQRQIGGAPPPVITFLPLSFWGRILFSWRGSMGW